MSPQIVKVACCCIKQQQASESHLLLWACCRRQEAYERELEKYAVRRNPLGMDRHHRYYWCVIPLTCRQTHTATLNLEISCCCWSASFAIVTSACLLGQVGMPTWNCLCLPSQWRPGVFPPCAPHALHVVCLLAGCTASKLMVGAVTQSSGLQPCSHAQILLDDSPQQD